jgi:hypothetical protein
MNTEALFLFLILLLGLLLCSFLGGNCGREGFSGKFSGTFDVTDSDTNMQSSSGVSTTSSNKYDNYNHYTGSSTQLSPGTTFYGENGRTATIITHSDGSQSLEITLPGASLPVTFTSQQSNPDVSKSASSNPASSTCDTLASQKTKSKSLSSTVENYTNFGPATTYYGPNDTTANLITTDNGQQAVKVNTPSGTYYYNTSGTQTNTGNNGNTSGSQSTTSTSTQYYGSTGSPIQKSPDKLAYQGSSADITKGKPASKTTSTDNGYTTNQNYAPYSLESPSVQGNNVYYSQGRGASVNGTTSSDYYSSLPPGIPRSQIPPEQEDLYILKSQVVPPVCPACPTSAICERIEMSAKQEKCPPCPPCARCPEPSFECKKVPNYSAINNDYLPTPVLNDFSNFGM